MQSISEYQLIFTKNIAGGVLHYMLNNPIISWDNGFIQGFTGLCFLIALLDAIGSLSNSKEFARKVLTMAFMLLIVLANYGQVNPREVIDFDLQEYDYTLKPEIPSKLKLNIPGMNGENLNKTPTLDRDIYNALAKFFNGLSASLRKVINQKPKSSTLSSKILPENLQTHAFNETIFILDQARYAKIFCSAEQGTTLYKACLSEYIPLGDGSDVTKKCTKSSDGSRKCTFNSEEEVKEAETSRFIPDGVMQFFSQLASTFNTILLVFSDIVFTLFFPILIWILEVLRNIISLILLIGYFLGVAGMMFFAKLITPLLLIPSQRKSVFSAYRNLFALALFGFVTDIFVFFTTIMMMGVHYSTYQTMRLLFKEAAAAKNNPAMAGQFSGTFVAVTMMIYFVIITILIINILALTKIKPACEKIANFSFAQLVQVGNDLVSKGMAASAVLMGGLGMAVTGGIMAAGAGVVGAAKGAIASGGIKGMGAALKGTATGALKGKGLKGRALGFARGLKDTAGQAAKLADNAKLGAGEALFGDKGQRAMLTRNIDNSVLGNKDKDNNQNEKLRKQKAEGKGGASGGEDGIKMTAVSGGGDNSGQGNSSEEGQKHKNFSASDSGDSNQNNKDSSSTENQGKEANNQDESKISSPREGKEGFFNRSLLKDDGFADKMSQKLLGKKLTIGALMSGGMAASRKIGDTLQGRPGDMGFNASLGQKMVKKGTAAVKGADEFHTESLERIEGNKKLLEEKRDALDLTDSGVTQRETSIVMDNLDGLGYEKNKEKLNEFNDNLSNIDLKNTSEDDYKEVHRLMNTVDNETMESSLSGTARQKAKAISRRDDYKAFAAKEKAKSEKLMAEYSNSKSQKSLRELKSRIDDGSIGKGNLQSFDKNITDSLISSLTKENDKSVDKELNKIVEMSKNGDEENKKQAEIRSKMLLEDQDLKESHLADKLMENDKATDTLNNLGAISNNVKKNIKKSSDAKDYQEKVESLNEKLKVVSEKNSDGDYYDKIGDNLTIQQEEDFDGTINTMIKLNEKPIDINENGEIELSKTRDPNVREELLNLKNELDTVINDEKLTSRMDPMVLNKWKTLYNIIKE